MFDSAQLAKLTPEQVRDIAEGKILLMEVLGVTPGEMLHHLETALNLIGINKLDDATRILKGLAALDVRNPAFVSALGSIELMKKNYPAAIEYSQRAVKVDPKFATAYYVLGESLAQVRRPEEAVRAFETAFELRPGDGSRDAKRCRTIYTSLTGKVPPGPPQAAAGRPQAAPAPGRAPMAGPPQAMPRPAGQPVPRSMPVPAGRGSAHGGAYGRPGAGPAMIGRTGAVPQARAAAPPTRAAAPPPPMRA